MPLILDIIGVLGFLVSFSLAYLYLKDYFGHLAFGVNSIEVHRRKGLSYSLLNIHFYFENNSSRGKTIHNVGYTSNPPDYIRLIDFFRQADASRDKVVLDDEKGEEAGYIPLDEHLEFPLNITAHQIQSKCYPLRISWVNPPQDKQVQGLPFEMMFYCYDEKGKIVAHYPIYISLNDVQHSVLLEKLPQRYS